MLNTSCRLVFLVPTLTSSWFRVQDGFPVFPVFPVCRHGFLRRLMIWFLISLTPGESGAWPRGMWPNKEGPPVTSASKDRPDVPVPLRSLSGRYSHMHCRREAGVYCYIAVCQLNLALVLLGILSNHRVPFTFVKLVVYDCDIKVHESEFPSSALLQWPTNPPAGHPTPVACL